jgi:asparagine synthase (glutamine-hydrolysing)
MCGIAGIFRFDGVRQDAAVVERMLAKLARRGPDDSGIHASGPVVLGNRRLAVLDRTAAAHQPMSSSCGQLVVTFNGEIYNYRELCRELAVEPGQLRSTSDTEVLLLAWQRWGPGALDRFVGQWAFAIYDTVRQRMWLARDRFGEKPLYLHSTAERMAFSSSLGSLMLAPGVPHELDSSAIAEYLALRYVVSPRTVVRGVHKLSPGHLLEIDADGVMREREWYSPRFRPACSSAPRSRQSLEEQFDALFTQACERCLVSDVPVGLLLSDGIDSNSIATALALKGHKPPAFTFRLTNPQSGIQPETVSGAGGEVFDISTSPGERCSAFDDSFACLTEPVGDGASLATWMLIRGARKRATVLLCGHGGDEIFGGYRLSQDRFRLAMLRRLSWIPGSALDPVYERFLTGSGPLAERRAQFAAVPIHEAPSAARYLVDRPLPSDQVLELLGDRYPDGDHYLSTVERLYGDCQAGATDIDRIQEVLIRTFLSANILSFADSVAMDASVELRMPFLDRDLVDFALTLRPGERISPWPGRANTKLILREWARGRVASEVVRRPKRGFQSGNISELLQHDGRGLRHRILNSSAVRRVAPGVEKWLSRIGDDYGGPWGGTLWALLVLGVWSESVGAR